MNKKIAVLLASLALIASVLIGVVSCAPKTDGECQHSWSEATCTAPKTCTLCSATEGEALGHSGGTATCIEKATCTTCGEKYGELALHDFADATCTEAKTCKNCPATEGEALGHSGGTATCTEKATCTTCGEKHGELALHDFADATCTEAKTCKNCPATEGEPAGHKGGSATCKDQAYCTVCSEPYGSLAEHSFTVESNAEKYLVTEATCTAAAVYKKSCSVCGEAGSETFTYGELKKHNLELENTNNDGTHTLGCTACVYTEKEDCFGGSAYCGGKAVCSTCNTEYGEVGAHSWDDGEVTTQAGCATDGVMTFSCSGCTEKYTRTIPASGHKYVPTVTEPTCTEKGYTTNTCSACGDSYKDAEVVANGHTGGTATCSKKAVCTVCSNEYGLLADHTYDQQNTGALYLKSAATCESAAVYYYSCVCGAKGSESFEYGDKLEHSYKTTANEDGTHTVTCSNGCGYDNTEDCSGGTATCQYLAECEKCGAEYGSYAGHSYGEWTVTNATCNENGSESRSCGNCGATETNPIAAAGHKYENEGSKAVTAPTCTEDGYTTYTCDNCGYSYTADKVSASGHSYKTTVTEPTCTAKGYTTYTCSCGDSYKSDETAVADHSWNQIKTCTEGRECKNCGASEEALGHNYVAGTTVAATCLYDGYTVYTCQNGCGGTENRDTVAATGHNTVALAVEVHIEGCKWIQTYECNNCDDTVNGDYAYYHTYQASVTKDATCVSEGEWLYTCADCDDSYTKTIEKNDNHAWDDGVKSGNIITYTCEDCDETKTVVDASASTDATVSTEDLASAGEVKLENANINLGEITDSTLSESSEVQVSANTINKEDLLDSGLSEEELEQVGDNPVYDFNLYADGEQISQLGGTVTITLPYTLSEGEDVDSIAVWYIDDEGNLTSIKATYSGGYVTFQTDHFSYYTVTRLTPKQRCEIYGHNYTSMTVSVTCTEDGYTFTRCIRCGETKKENIVKAEGHDLSTERTDATCTVNGSLSISCSKCSYKASEVIPASGHEYSETDRTDATCTASGRISYKCDSCERTYSEIIAMLKHSYKDTVTEPTCSAGGYTTHECENCSDKYTDSFVPAVDHDYEDEIIAPECGKKGYTKHSCKHCKHHFEDNYTEARDHEFDDDHCKWEWRDDHKSAHYTLECKHGCGHKVEGDVDAVEKDYEPTCSADGGHKYTVKFTHNGITFTHEHNDVKEATGKHNYKPGHKHDEHHHWYICEDCGDKHEQKEHEWDSGVITIQPGCNAEGEMSYTCECGRVKQEKIPATDDHYYKNGVCVGCGKEEPKVSGCDHTELTEVTIDFAELGYCVGYLTYKTCECGEVAIVDDMDNFENFQCDIETDDYTEESDDATFIYLTVTGHCTVCGLKLKATMNRTYENCEMKVIVSYGYYTSEDEEIAFATYSESEEVHNSYSKKEIGVADVSSCGTAVYGYVCDDCGKVVDFNSLEPDVKCENIDWYYEENSDTRVVRVNRCDDCGYEVRLIVTLEQPDACTYIEHYVGILKVGDTEFARMEYDEVYDNHDYELTETIMKGETCEDGWQATYSCTVCGDNIVNYGSGHGNQREYIDLSEYGICEGQACRYYCQICNKTNSIDIGWSGCSFEYVGEDSDGNSTYKCSVCGVSRVYKSECSEMDENCTYTVTEGYCYYFTEGEIILDLMQTYYSSCHDWERIYELKGESCEDGYICYNVCAACGYTQQWEGSGHSTEWQNKDFKEYGMCGGYLDGRFCRFCDYSDISSYYDYGCSWSETGEENGFVIYSCVACGTVKHEKITQTEKDENCYYTITKEAYYYRDGECILSLVSENGYREHNYEYSYEFDGEVNCESGVTVYVTCSDCDYSEEYYWTWHYKNSEYVYFSDYGSCGGNGYVQYYSCPCGYSSGINFSGCGNGYWEHNKYTDEEGRLIVVESYHCEECQLRYTNSYYSEKGEGCTLTTYHTVIVSIGESLVFTKDYSSTRTSHDTYRTVALNEGSKTCSDGITVTEQCRDCDYSNSWTKHWHQTGVAVRIDASECGSDCGGIVEIMMCACGQSYDISVENCLCDLDHSYTQNWMEGYLDTWQETADGHNGFHSYSYIYSCAVTDPEKCGFAIRYSNYWLATGNCTATYYLTVQVGYDADTGSCAEEYTYELYSRTYHNYAESSIENGWRYECSDCGSYYQYYNYSTDNGWGSRYEYVNTLDDGCAKERVRIEEWTNYDLDGDGEYERTEQSKFYHERTYADGSVYWYQELYSYEAYDAPFGQDACTRYTSYTNSNGEADNRILSYTWVYAENHGGITITFFERYERDEYWYQYEHSYSFENGCERTTVFTDSNGQNTTSVSTDHIWTTRTNIVSPTCTQPGLYARYCLVCQQTLEEGTVLEPNDHNWYQISEDLYYCVTCGLQGIGGADGVMVIEDLTEQYGNGENYVIGYWNRSNVEFEVYVSLIFYNEEIGDYDQIILDVPTNLVTDPYIGLWVSKEAVKAAAEAAGYLDESAYEIRISFVPVTASSEFDYAITFGDLEGTEGIDYAISDDASLDIFAAPGKYQHTDIMITPETDGYWIFYSQVESGDSYAYLLDADGNELCYNDDGNGNLNFRIEYYLEAGKTYYLRVRWYNQTESIGYIPVVIDKQ